MGKIYSSFMAICMAICMAVGVGFTASATDYTISAISPTYDQVKECTTGDDFWGIPTSFNLTLSPNVSTMYITATSSPF